MSVQTKNQKNKALNGMLQITPINQKQTNEFSVLSAAKKKILVSNEEIPGYAHGVVAQSVIKKKST